jgi:hypothetical protein
MARVDEIDLASEDASPVVSHHVFGDYVPDSVRCSGGTYNGK